MGKGVKRETNKGGSITTFLSKAEDFQGIYNPNLLNQVY
jgi:hypothetical protein